MQSLFHRKKMIPFENLVITADDFGVSPGVNQAVINAYTKGGLTNASLMVTAIYFAEAIKLSRESAPGLKLGLHINLTGGKSVLPIKRIPHLVDIDGNFKYGPVGLLLQTIFNPHILNEIESEIEAQIQKLQLHNVQIEHIDGHHHMQMIPKIFPIVKRLADKHGIKRLRVVNESLVDTICKTRRINFLFNGGIARYLLLKTMYFFNNYKTTTYFFSILNSCRITPELVKNLNIPNGFKNIEIMLHPGNPDLDKNIDDLLGEKPHLTSVYREVELNTALQFKRS